jgi:hypothetical protein
MTIMKNDKKEVIRRPEESDNRTEGSDIGSSIGSKNTVKKGKDNKKKNAVIIAVAVVIVLAVTTMIFA